MEHDDFFLLLSLQRIFQEILSFAPVINLSYFRIPETLECHSCNIYGNRSASNGYAWNYVLSLHGFRVVFPPP